MNIKKNITIHLSADDVKEIIAMYAKMEEGLKEEEGDRRKKIRRTSL